MQRPLGPALLTLWHCTAKGRAAQAQPSFSNVFTRLLLAESSVASHSTEFATCDRSSQTEGNESHGGFYQAALPRLRLNLLLFSLS